MRVSVTKIQGMKAKGERIPMLTAYDYPTARLAARTAGPPTGQASATAPTGPGEPRTWHRRPPTFASS